MTRATRALVSVLCLFPSLLAAQQRGQEGRATIAVLPFSNRGSVGQGREDFDALERGIAGMMISELAQNPAARVLERQQVQRLIDQQNLDARGRVDPATMAKLGKQVGARYIVLGTFVDFYGDFHVDIHLINAETGQVVKTESDKMQRDHLFDMIRNLSGRLMRDANLPDPQRQGSDPRLVRQIPTEALTYYSRALLYWDRGQNDKAVEMFNRALAIFPDYAEARDGLKRVNAP